MENFYFWQNVIAVDENDKSSPGSFIVVRKSDFAAVAEFYSVQLVGRVNRVVYDVYTAKAYLFALNRKILAGVLTAFR